MMVGGRKHKKKHGVRGVMKKSLKLALKRLGRVGVPAGMRGGKKHRARKC